MLFPKRVNKQLLLALNATPQLLVMRKENKRKREKMS